MSTHLLRIDASMRRTGSVTRTLSDQLVKALAPQAVTTRDLADGLPLINEAWIDANFTPEAERTTEHRAALWLSDTLVSELDAADTIVLGLPMYNFSVPGALKAWIDLVARAGKTFKYTDSGPVGLLRDKKAYIVLSSGGVAKDSPVDFATAYLTHALAFIGVTDVEVIDASGQMLDADAAATRANDQITALTPCAQNAATAA